MADHDPRYDILEAAPVVPEPVYLEHMTAFVESFVVAAKKERWQELLAQRPRRLSSNSSKLYHVLDQRRCVRTKSLATIAQREPGVFFDFHDEARLLLPEQAVWVGSGSDAIYSMVPGRLAVYFFHESETFICQA